MFFKRFAKIILASIVFAATIFSLMSSLNNFLTFLVNNKSIPFFAAQFFKRYPTITLLTPYNNALAISETQFPERICNIADYGAVADGTTKNSEAIQKAIFDCSKKGGGKVLVPPGQWFTGAIKLESNIDLEVQEGAELLFSTDYSDYLPVVFSRFEGIEYYNYSAPIYANNAENIAVTGKGTLNGQGDKFWWKISDNGDINKLYEMGDNNVSVKDRIFGVQPTLRPAFLEFVDCNRVLLDGPTILNGPMWTIHPLYSQNVIARNLTVQTAPGPSTDGIVIDSSKNIWVENSVFTTGDDAIVIKSGRNADGRRVNKSSENIVIENCDIQDGHGIVAIGSEMSGGVRNVLAQNITAHDAQYGFRIKTNSLRGGFVENVWIRNFNILDLANDLIQISTDYENPIIGYVNLPPLLNNINIENIFCHRAVSTAVIAGLSEKPVENLRLKNINVDSSRNGLSLKNVRMASLSGIKIGPKYGPTFDIVDSQNITLADSECLNENIDCFQLKGENSRDIKLINNLFTNDEKNISLKNGAEQSALVIQNSQ